MIIDWWQDFGSRYPKNQTLQWCDTDCEKNHSSNEYDEHSISYLFNSQGLRSRELVREPGRINILVSGCSHTMGIGLPEHHAWPHQLCELIENSVVHNVAIGGASSDYVARSVWIATRLIGIDAIFVLWPDSSRFEYFDNTGPCNIQVTDPSYPKILLCDEHHYNTLEKNIIMTKLIAGSIPLYHAPQALGLSPDSAPRARDGIHNCRIWHQSVAQGFYIKYLENDQDDRFSTAQHIIDYQQQHDHQ